MIAKQITAKIWTGNLSVRYVHNVYLHRTVLIMTVDSAIPW